MIVTATRAGLLNARSSRLAAQSEELGLKSEKTLELIRRRASLRDSLRLLLTVLRFLIAGLVLAMVIPLDESVVPLPILAGWLALTSLGIWLVEFFVERRILNDPEGWAVRLTPMAQIVAALMGPLLALPTRLASRSREPQQLVTITEDELRLFVDASQREGVLEKEERRMIFSIFEFADTLVREIMLPRIDIFALDVNTTIDEARSALIETGYSRVPVYSETIDNIIGLLYAKDMLKVWNGGGQTSSLRDLLRNVNFVPESKKLDALLAEMQAGRFHIAIVVDEYGGVAGLVTLEDMMEEIVGEIQDEYDQGEELPYQKISDEEYIFHGRFNLDDFNEIMGSSLSSEDADTVGGFLFNEIGHVPKAGEQWETEGLHLKVEQVAGRRVRRVRARRVANPETSEDNANHAD
ncbi:MAG: HlyC/CorC family transporter [Anaerolineales bacterium]|nr:HlyC/CorC family transporter [Anaerolineales bacterium]MCW5855432.1 HlyC/CorC family transporter [Anaerolineales bacterium]